MKIYYITLIILLGIIGYFVWIIFGPTIQPETDKNYLYIKTGSSYDDVVKLVQKNKIVTNSKLFDLVAKKMHYPNLVKPGKYTINDGMSIATLIKKLRSGKQEPVKLVINKTRTKEQFAKKIASHFEFESEELLKFLNSDDSLHSIGYNLDNVFIAIIPDTYEYYWNTTPRKLMNRLIYYSNKFWTKQRKKKAKKIGHSPEAICILASILDEETEDGDEKPLIASVYLNRLKIGKRLQADPTIKFSLNDFTLTRILNRHLKVKSPYNTYQNKGLPPGPICTPSKESIDAVLNAPATDYLFFVANSDFSRTHIFTTNYADHLYYAAKLHKALNERDRDMEKY